MITQEIVTKVSNLIRVEYNEFERDDIKVEMYREDSNNGLYYFTSFHKRDTVRRYARYWTWNTFSKNLVENFNP